MPGTDGRLLAEADALRPDFSNSPTSTPTLRPPRCARHCANDVGQPGGARRQELSDLRNAHPDADKARRSTSSSRGQGKGYAGIVNALSTPKTAHGLRALRPYCADDRSRQRTRCGGCLIDRRPTTTNSRNLKEERHGNKKDACRVVEQFGSRLVLREWTSPRPELTDREWKTEGVAAFATLISTRLTGDCRSSRPFRSSQAMKRSAWSRLLERSHPL